ncbi:MAG: TRAP transporter substrate-binding protein [Desulfovibrio sp.]
MIARIKLLLPIFFLLAIMAQPAMSAQKTGAPVQKAPENNGKPMVLDMLLGDPEDSEMGILGIAFKNYISQASKGQLEIQLAYSGGLDADEAYQFHRVQTGKIDMALGGIGNLVPMVRNLGVVTLPYLFPDQNAVVRGTTGKAAMLLDSYAEKAGLKILAWTYYGYRYISNSRRPIKSLEDMRGLKFRVPQSLEMIRTYRAFGGIPMPLAWPMTRSALKNNLVDGQCYDYSGFRAMKFQDVGQKYITEIHYIYNLQPLVTNLKIFEKLGDEDRKILLEAGRHIQELSLQYQKEMNDVAKRALIASGVHITTLEDEAPWKNAAMVRVWPESMDNIGGIAAINAYLSACGLPEWKPDGEKGAEDVKK